MAVSPDDLSRPDTLTCPACGEANAAVLHTETAIPVNSCLLVDTEAEAIAFGRGDMAFALCADCGFAFNAAFDQKLAEYDQRYEETQQFSGRFVEFATDLARRWVVDYDLAGKRVLEVGCGKGEFLVMMADAGIGSGIGIDPGVHPERIDNAGHDLTWIPDFYSADYTHLEADAIVCRHTLEHIPDVADFMTRIRAAIGDQTDTVVLFELPDVQRILDEVAFWDIYYEHCSYFGAGSLARLFRRTGFEVLDVQREYDDQYLVIAARPSTTPAGGAPLPIEDDLEALRSGAAGFGPGYRSLIDRWSTRLAEAETSGERVVIWGSGSKGVSFLSNLGGGRHVDAAVDINPFKWGKFMAGTGHPIVGPDDLPAQPPDLVIVMNPIYTEEITAELASRGLHPVVEAL